MPTAGTFSIADIPPGHPRRRAVEALIGAVYARRYGAFIRAFPNHLVAAFADTAEPIAACGLRGAEGGFFSECYLDHPIERRIRAVFGIDVARSEILEITTLASLRAAAANALFRHVIAEGRGRGMSTGVFTTTRPMVKMIRRAGVDVVEIGTASRDRVPNPRDWGRYYDGAPAVYAVADRQDAPVAFCRPAYLAGDAPAPARYRETAHA